MPTSKALRDARDEFRALLSQRGSEAAFQKLFTKHPHILSNSLPLRLRPADILPRGRPGKAEVDFLIYPNQERLPHVHGSVEIKRPDTRILKVPRKNIVTLSSDATTAIAQGQKYARELGREVIHAHRPVVLIGNSQYVFLILGMQAELHQKLSSNELREQFDSLLPPGCTLIPYDTLLSAYEASLPPLLHILVPGTPVRSAVRRRPIPPPQNQVFWQLCAEACARYASEREFHSRRGTYPFIVKHRESVMCIYNNNPYASDPLMRDDETRRFRRRLQHTGIIELAYATYPLDGEDAGYSYAMLLDVPQEDKILWEQVHLHLQECLSDSLDMLHAKRKES